MISRNESPPVFFYLSPEHWPGDLSATEDENWPGYKDGVYAWTLQTFFRLRDAGSLDSLIRRRKAGLPRAPSPGPSGEYTWPIRLVQALMTPMCPSMIYLIPNLSSEKDL